MANNHREAVRLRRIVLACLASLACIERNVARSFAGSPLATGPSLRGTRIPRMDSSGGLFQQLPSFDFSWIPSDFTTRYWSELAASLAAWTAPTVSLVIVALAVGLSASLSSGKGPKRDDFGFEDDEDETPMGFMLGGRKSKKAPLKIRSWNRQVDRYTQTMTRAMKGLAEAQKLKKEQEESYTKLETDEVALVAKAKDGSKDESKEKAVGRTWVLDFNTGRADLAASGVKQLREEITAVVACADSSRDEVVLRLDSGGGTVTGYGLAGAQLLRLREAGLKLTVAIDQVAASGGYLMACTADSIVCSPFAIIGSIGVVQELPIVYDRLKREGINYETTTAGKFKRTLTPFKEPTDEDRKKNKEDLEEIWGVFKDFVVTSRPALDIDKVATGETWLGPKAKEQGLVDDLKTSDALLLGHVRDGRQVLEVSYSKPSGSPLQQALQGAATTFGNVIKGPGQLTAPPMAKSQAEESLPSAWSGL